MTPRPRWAARKLVGWAFFFLTVYSVFAVLDLTVFRVTGSGGPHSFAAGLAAAALLVLLVVAEHDRFAETARRWGERLAVVSDRRWLTACIGIGIAVRGIWCAIVPPVQYGNAGQYLGLASSLAERGVFEFQGITLYLPPGLPFLLVPSVTLFGPHPLVPLLNNLVFFAVTILAVDQLTRRLAGRAAARLATALLVGWPNLVMISGIAAKEVAALALLSVTVLLFVKGLGGDSSPSSWWRIFAAGVAMGATMLVQPASLVMLGAFLAFEVVRGDAPAVAVRRLGVLLLGTTLCVAPWTIRNAVRFRAFVLVSANGGHSLYVGNNPEATGGFLPVRQQWRHLDELTYDRTARRMAIEWIRSNPTKFLSLAITKQILFLGDDADGAWEALKRGYGISDRRFVIAKGVCLAFWLGVLVLLAVSTWRLILERGTVDPRLQLLMLLFFCMLLLLSVTESGGRHHIALSGFAAALVGRLAGLDEAPSQD